MNSDVAAVADQAAATPAPHPLTVLIYTRAFAPSVGGVERITADLAAGLAASGWRVTVATATAGEDVAAGGYGIVRRPGVLRLWRLIGQAEVVHLAGPAWLPLALARLRGRAVVVVHHTYQAVCPNGMLLQLPARTPCPGHFQAHRYGQCMRCGAVDAGRARTLWRLLAAAPRAWLLRGVTHVAPSAWVAAQLRGYEAVAIPHGMDIVPVATDAASPTADAPQQLPRLVFVGRLVREKGVDTLISALAVLRLSGRKVHLTIIGDGPERATLQAQAALLGVADSVTFTGAVPPPLVARQVAGATLQTMPSRCGETFGLAVLEALAVGVPLLTTNFGGQAEVAGNAALLVPPNDVRALADAVAGVLDDPARLAALAAAGPLRAAAFSRERMVRAHAALLAQAAVRRYPE